MDSVWSNMWSPLRGQGLRVIQMLLGHPKSLRISNSSAWTWESLPSRKTPWGLTLSWGEGYHLWLKQGSPAVCCSIFSKTAMYSKLPLRLKDLSWEQQFSAGRRVSNWESLIPYSFKSNFWRLAETFSRRTGKSSRLKSVMVTPLRFRPLSWLMFRHWDRWIQSDSVSWQ